MRSRWVPAVAGGLLLASCSATSAQVASAPAPVRAAVPHASAPHPSKVLVIVEENHSASAALSGMPNLARQAKKYGYATQYTAAAHPSLPNYLALAGGSTFGVGDDAAPEAHRLSGASVFDQALAAGKTARLYAESMSSRCQQTPSGTYAVKHNPWAYFSDASSRSGCNRYDLPAGTTTSGTLAADIRAGRLPTVGMLVPNLCNDGHDCSLATADAWLQRWLDVIGKGPDWNAGRLAVVVTFDENDGGSPNQVLTVVLSKRVSHVVTRTRLSHPSWTRYADELLGVRPLRAAANATSLRTAFGL